MKRLNLVKTEGYSKLAPPHLILSLFLIFVCCAGELRAQPRLDKTNWRCVFSENFDTPVQGRPNVWSTRITHGDFQEGNIMYPSNVQYRTLANQKDAVLKSLVNPTVFNATYTDAATGTVASAPCYWNSGLLRTVYDDYLTGGGTYPMAGYNNDTNGPGGWLYGMFEVRCKLPKHRASGPALWLHANNNRPPELDIFESNTSDLNSWSDPVNSPGNHIRTFSSIHYNNPIIEDICSVYSTYPGSYADDWHTWTMVWTPYEVAYFMDSVEMMSTTDVLKVAGHHSRLTAEPIPTLLNCMQDLIIHNWTHGQNSTRLNDWNRYTNLGIAELGDLIVDKVQVYRPEGLSEPITTPPYYRPLAYNTSTPTAFGIFVNDFIIPAYLAAPFRAANGWKQEYVGWDINEYRTGDYTTDYKIVGTPVVTKGADEGFFFVNAQSGSNKLSYGKKTPTVGNPDRYTVFEIDNTVLTNTNIAGGRVGINGALTVFYAVGTQLTVATSTDGIGWAKYDVPFCNDVAGGMVFDNSPGFETLLYKGTGNKLVSVTKASNGIYSVAVNLTNSAKLYNATTTNAPSDVGDCLLFDPVNANEYYYRSTDGLKIVKMYKTSGVWRYRATAISGGVSVLKTSVKGDNTWRKIYYTKTNTKSLFAFDPNNFTSSSVVSNGGYVTNVLDFVAGNSHDNTALSTTPKNIYFTSGFDQRLYMMTWNIAQNQYNTQEVSILGLGYNLVSLNNMLPDGSDLPTFVRTDDGRLRKLRYGAQSPINNLICNACWNGGNPCNAWWQYSPVMPLDTDDNGDLETENQNIKD